MDDPTFGIYPSDVLLETPSGLWNKLIIVQLWSQFDPSDVHLKPIVM